MTDSIEGQNTATKILDAIKAYWDQVGFSPSIRDIVEAVDVSSTSVVSYHLERLEERGLIKRTPGISRSIVILEQSMADEVK